jgi:CHAT domain-containing protein
LLSLLPLHAAGHHHDHLPDRSSPLPRTVIDRVISSYTPTIQMLRRARRLLRELPVGRPRVLMVSMPNAPGARHLSKVWDEAFASAVQSNIRILSDQEATRQQVIAELPAYTWVHFACHSCTDLVRPSASYLGLHDHAEQPLTAQDISGLRLRGAQLAFLSACDTARTSGDLADEAIHLGSSFQIAGYPHVVATLWPVSDEDANLVAAVFYEGLADSAGPDRDCFATAVHEAIRMRRSTVSRKEPWKWSGYIHMGP